MRAFFYRLVMRIAHYYNWHYAPPIYPNGDTQLWCKWCGFRQTIKTSTYRFDGIITADKVALASDWKAVGNDIRKALGK